MFQRLFTIAIFTALVVALPLTSTVAQMREGHGGEQLFQYDASHPAYRDIQRENSLGRDHIEGPVDYGTPFPTSGPHNPVWVDPGFYDEAMALENLVHSLEHGNIVIYFDEPGDAAMKVIRGWTDRFQGQWDGIVATRVEGMSERVVLTAWQHRLDLAKFDVRASFFVDAFRGRGPENRVR